MDRIINLIENLSKATPKKNILYWILLSGLYGFAIIANDHYDLIASLGLPAKSEAVIRLCGVSLYICITTFHFQKTTKHEYSSNDTEVTAGLADHHLLHHPVITAGTPVDAPGDQPGNTQPDAVQSGTAGNITEQRQDSQPDRGNAAPAEGTR